MVDSRKKKRVSMRPKQKPKPEVHMDPAKSGSDTSALFRASTSLPDMSDDPWFDIGVASRPLIGRLRGDAGTVTRRTTNLSSTVADRVREYLTAVASPLRSLSVSRESVELSTMSGGAEYAAANLSMESVIEMHGPVRTAIPRAGAALVARSMLEHDISIRAAEVVERGLGQDAQLIDVRLVFTDAEAYLAVSVATSRRDSPQLIILDAEGTRVSVYEGESHQGHLYNALAAIALVHRT